MRLAADNLWAVIEAATAEELDWLDGYLTVPVKGAEYSEAYERGVWDGSVKLLDRKRSRVASGLLRLVAGRAKEAGFAFDVQDVRVKPVEAGAPLTLDGCGWLRDYQREALGVVMHRGRGIVSMSTGSGKTEIFTALGACVGIRWLVLVDTKDLMHQAADRFYQRTGERAGLAGDGEWEPRRYTVATLQTLHKHMGDKGRVDQLLASAQGMIADEVQVLSATEFRKVAVATVNAWWRVGFSATPFERSDEADYRAIEVLGPLIHDVMPGPLIAAGWLAEPRIWMVRHQHQKMTGTFAEVYEAGVTLNEGRNALVRRIVADRDLCPRPSMLFFSKLAHGRALDRSLNPLGVRTVFVEGASSSRARDSARHQLRVRLRDVLVTSKVFNKGIDIPEVEGGVNAAAGDSRIDALQKVGRLMRVVESKSRVVRYFDFDDVGNRWLEQHSRHRADAFRSRGYTVHHVRPEDLGAIARAA